MVKANRWLSLVLTLMFLTVGATSALALDLTIESVTVGAGATFDVKVTFSEETAFQGGEVDIAYDANVLTFNSGTPPSTHAFSNVGIVGDNIKVVVAGMSSAAPPDNVLATLNFTAAADATGTSDITFADVSVGFDGNSIPFTPVDGVLTIASNPTVTAIIGANGGMTVNGGDASGEKSFSPNDEPVYTVTPNDGYQVAVFKVDTVEVQLAEDNTYTFSALQMGDSRTIEVTFEAIPLPTVTATVKDATGGSISTDTGTDGTAQGQKIFEINSAPVYTLSPDQGYKVTAFTVDTVDAIDQLVAVEGTGKYTYTFAALTAGEAIAIEATFGPEVAPVITTTVGENGKITVNDASAEGAVTFNIGDAPVFTVTPDTGYKVETFQVNDTDATLVDGAYTFAELLEGDAHTVAVTFVEVVQPIITATVGENGNITVNDEDASGEKTYQVGDSITYKVVPNTDYEVDTFTVNGETAELTADSTYVFADLTEGNAFTIGATFKLSNSAPTATPIENFEVTIDESKSGQLAGVDEDGEIVSYAKVTDPEKVLLDLNAETGAFSIFFKGVDIATGDTDSFTFTVTDDKGAVSEAATVNIAFTKVIVAPVAQDMNLAADPAAPTTGTLTATDEDGVIASFAIVTQPLNGMVTLTDAATGAFRLNAFGGATGTDAFTFTATDDDGAVSEAGTVNITWGEPQEPPVPADAEAKCQAGESVSITLMATDPEGDPLTFAIDAQPTQGTVTIAGDVATYTANADAAGTDTFTFKANDGMVDSATAATVTVAIVEDIFDITATGTPEVGGTIAIDPADGKVEAGGDAKITVTIAEGYKVASVTDNGTAVTLNADNTYDLTAVDGPHAIAVTFAVIATGVNSADMNADFVIDLSELLRVQQIYTIGAYSCGTVGVEDGFVTGDGDQTCTPHAADYNPQNWKIELTEFLRIIQFYTMLGYHVAPEGVDTEDGFVAGPGE